MTDTTTIQITTETKDRLDDRKLDDESYDTAINRILDDSGVLFDQAEIEHIAAMKIRNMVVNEALR